MPFLKQIQYALARQLSLLLCVFISTGTMCDAQQTLVQPERIPESADRDRPQHFCKSPMLNMEENQRAMEYLAEGSRQSTPVWLIRVYFHICRNDDGSNPAATVSDLYEEFELLRSHYAPHNICFAFMGFDYVDDSGVNIFLDPDEPYDFLLLTPYLVPECLNIFYHGNLGDYGGHAYSIPNSFCSVTSGAIGSYTISHEVGHCLGLIHTHETVHGEGYISGYECDENGDLVCDTNADPWSEDLCFNSAGCAYVGSCTDPSGASNYNPPYFNIMSYWSACEPEQFTNGQEARMSSFLINSAILESLIASGSLTYGPASPSSGLVIKAAKTDLNTNSTVELQNSVEATLTAEYIQLNPGFWASPSTGFVSIKPHACD